MDVKLPMTVPCAVHGRAEDDTQQKHRNPHPVNAFRNSRTLGFIALVVVWLAAIVAARVMAARYERTPGPGAAPCAWPNDVSLQRSATHLTLLVFVHPRCPCTRATIETLDRVLRTCGDTVQTFVIACDPSRRDPDWRAAALLAAAAALPSCTVMHDSDAAVTRAFGAKTSGLVALYSPAGHVLYWGGMTEARGMSGQGVGAEVLRRAIAGERVTIPRPVFGCSLTGGE
ncbi:MAG: hypothetical protein CHACPFDD_02644 [Phycisphaerae bacterium]|nr:hypothetical protein [Phycisphaerae bacterium]